MSETIYRKLQKKLDTFSMGFPTTESGVEIDILSYLFSEDDAGLFLELTQKLETPETVAERTGRPVEEVSRQLDDMAERGLLFRLKKGGGAKYGAIPFVHGLFEFQVKSLQPELAKMVKAYHREAFNRSIQKSGEYFLRTIPVMKSVDTTQTIASFEDAQEILRGQKQIVVTDCICRKKNELTDGSCGKPLEACFMFGSMGQYYLDRDMGRKIDFDEAVEILEKCREAGLVTQPATTQNPTGMCNCCGDCCGILEAMSRHPRPAKIVFSNHYAVVDPEACTGCEACLERCQMDAVKLDDEDRARVDRDRCIGCGLCAATCPTEAIEMVLKSADDFRTPPPTSFDQMVRLAEKRGMA